MKKLCFVTTISDTLDAFVVQFADYLYKQGDYEITLICDEDKEFAKTLPPYLTYIPVRMERGKLSSGLSATRELKRIFKEKKFDIVHYATINASLYSSIAARLAKVPCRLYYQWGIRYVGFNPGIKRLAIKALVKLICVNSTAIECESKSIMDFGIKEHLYDTNKASIIGEGSACGVDLEKFDISNKDTWRKEIRAEYHIPEDAIVFGYVGRITRDKGINELLKAFSIIEGDNTYLMLVGRFDNEETLDQEILKKAKCNPHIIFTGPHRDTERYYSAMDVFASLSYREGFGIVVIEAGAMGIPGIVTTSIGQIDTACDEAKALLVPAKNVDKVVEKMNYCIENLHEVKTIGEKERLFVTSNFEQEYLFSLLRKHRDELIELSR